MRQRIFTIVECAQDGDYSSKAYDVFMIMCIIVSVIPLAFREQLPVFKMIEYVTTAVFTIDYILRFITEDYRSNKKSVAAFLEYPFTFYAVIDLLSILPTFVDIYFHHSLKLLRFIRALEVMKAFKLVHYSKSIRVTLAVFKNSKDLLKMVLVFAICYILVLALLIFNIEANNPKIQSFGDALYFAAISLTTVGYGDIVPTTFLGKVATVCSSLVGVAVIALPSGIITAGYIKAGEEKEATKQK